MSKNVSKKLFHELKFVAMKNPLIGTKKKRKPPFLVPKLSVDTTVYYIACYVVVLTSVNQSHSMLRPNSAKAISIALFKIYRFCIIITHSLILTVLNKKPSFF